MIDSLDSLVEARISLSYCENVRRKSEYLWTISQFLSPHLS